MVVAAATTEEVVAAEAEAKEAAARNKRPTIFHAPAFFTRQQKRAVRALPKSIDSAGEPQNRAVWRSGATQENKIEAGARQGKRGSLQGAARQQVQGPTRNKPQ